MILINTFEFQLLVSVIIGGLFVAFQTIIAERVQKDLSGILLSIPSTLVVSLFFLGWIHSVEVVVNIIPVIPPSFGMGLIFVCVYVYMANTLDLGRITLPTICTFIATLVWLLLAAPLAYLELTNIIISIFYYIFFVIVSHYLLAKRPSIRTRPITIRYTKGQIIIRSLTGGTIIGIIVVIAQSMGPFWGGIFSGFPAVFLSSLLIVHWNHGPEFLFHITKALPLASPIFPLYAFLVQYTYPKFGVEVGTLFSIILCLAYPILIIYIFHFIRSFSQRKY